MITIKKLDIYFDCKGNHDAYDLRFRLKVNKNVSAEEWVLFDGLVQDVTIINNELLSEILKLSLQKRLTEVCEDSQTENKLQ